MKCMRANCVASGDPGELVRVADFYVCNKCCSDIFTLEDIQEMTTQQRGCYVDDPGGDRLNIRHPQWIGWYGYQITKKSSYVTWMRLYGEDEKVLGGLVISDYTDSDYIIYNGPKYMLHIHNSEGFVSTLTIREDEIGIYSTTNESAGVSDGTSEAPGIEVGPSGNTGN